MQVQVSDLLLLAILYRVVRHTYYYFSTKTSQRHIIYGIYKSPWRAALRFSSPNVSPATRTPVILSSYKGCRCAGQAKIPEACIRAFSEYNARADGNQVRLSHSLPELPDRPGCFHSRGRRRGSHSHLEQSDCTSCLANDGAQLDVGAGGWRCSHSGDP